MRVLVLVPMVSTPAAAVAHAIRMPAGERVHGNQRQSLPTSVGMNSGRAVINDHLVEGWRCGHLLPANVDPARTLGAILAGDGSASQVGPAVWRNRQR